MTSVFVQAVELFKSRLEAVNASPGGSRVMQVIAGAAQGGVGQVMMQVIASVMYVLFNSGGIIISW